MLSGRLEAELPFTNRAGNIGRPAVQNGWNAISKPFADALAELTSSLENSSEGVAFFDSRLRCRALNRAFAAVWSLAPEKFLGKTLMQSVGPLARKLNIFLHRVLSSRSAAANLQLAAEPANDSDNSPLSINLFPVLDDAGRVRVVAATVSETSTLNFHLANMVAKLQVGLPATMCLLGASFPEVLARSLQSSSRTVRRLRSATTSRSPLYGTQLEIGIIPLALYLSLTGSRSTSPMAIMPIPAPEQVAPRRTPALVTSGAPEAVDLAAIALLEDLSPRERQVLGLLASGRSNKEIGLGLGISTRTVETYRARLIRKLGVHSTAELVRYAIRHKIVEP